MREFEARRVACPECGAREGDVCRVIDGATKGKSRSTAHSSRVAAANVYQILERFAKGAGFPTLETRNSDSLDFREVSVWEMRDALQGAFNAGANARKESKKGKQS